MEKIQPLHEQRTHTDVHRYNHIISAHPGPVQTPRSNSMSLINANGTPSLAVSRKEFLNCRLSPKQREPSTETAMECNTASHTQALLH